MPEDVAAKSEREQNYDLRKIKKVKKKEQGWRKWKLTTCLLHRMSWRFLDRDKTESYVCFYWCYQEGSKYYVVTGCNKWLTECLNCIACCPPCYFLIRKDCHLRKKVCDVKNVCRLCVCYQKCLSSLYLFLPQNQTAKKNVILGKKFLQLMRYLDVCSCLCLESTGDAN